MVHSVGFILHENFLICKFCVASYSHTHLQKGLEGVSRIIYWVECCKGNPHLSMFLVISWDNLLLTCRANLIEWSDFSLQKLNEHHAMHDVMFEILARNLDD